ncbi:sensor histidine kinase [Brachybacterium sp. AOP24-D1-21]|uniref:sensor histidine kinase n=1 Tax=Brachybacterium sp. AOP24-D1-21 TaxID=3457711 RepID=UPI0040334637
MSASTVRIVREAVTNIIKHGPTRPHVSIDLRADDHGIRLGISNSLSGTTSPEDFPRTSGYGLARLRERASLLGGTLETQQSGESFTLMARLPEK